ncbi:MAG: hypothetical protein AAB639_01210 [Patescibacteria group bacterium]
MKKIVYRYWNRILKYKILLIILSLLSIINLIISKNTQGVLSNLSVNLSAIFIGVIFTVFIFDEIVMRQKENEYQEAYLNSKDDLILLANMMVTYLREPFGFKFPLEKIDTSKNLNDESSRVNRESIKEVITHLKSHMLAASVSDWKRLVMNIFFLRQELSQVIPLYKEIIPPNLLGKVLSLGKSFKTFDYSFALLADLFVNEPKDWPKNKLGQANNVRIRNNQLLTLEKNINDILNKTELLFNELDKWRAID